MLEDAEGYSSIALSVELMTWSMPCQYCSKRRASCLH